MDSMVRWIEAEMVRQWAANEERLYFSSRLLWSWVVLLGRSRRRVRLPLCATYVAGSAVGNAAIVAAVSVAVKPSAGKTGESKKKKPSSNRQKLHIAKLY